MVKINEDVTYYRDTGQPHQGYYLDGYLKTNIDDYMIKAVENKFDCVLLVSGPEGAGKSTLASTIATYLDPTFPGEPLNDGTPRRKCTRIVFTHKQVEEAIDAAHKGECVLIDEAILSMFSQDFSSDLQKVLIKKFTLIRKKRLYIIVVIPSIFLLRKYFAIFRTRACVHCRVDEGIKRGTFNFYSYNSKRSLWIRGIKEFDQGCVKPDFTGAFTDTAGFFYDDDEYQKKKDEAITQLTAEPEKEKVELRKIRKEILIERDGLFLYIFNGLKLKNPKFSQIEYTQWLKDQFGWEISESALSERFANARKSLETNTEKFK